MPKSVAPPPSGLVIVIAILALCLLATGVVLVAGDNDASTARIGLLFAMFGVVLPVLFAALKSDQTATQTNGSLDGRIHAAVTAAMQDRADSVPTDRSTDK